MSSRCGASWHFPPAWRYFPSRTPRRPRTSSSPRPASSPPVDQRFLFVVNANSELRYDSGSILVIDLAKVEAAIASPPADCSAEPDHPETLQCDEAQFINQDAGVRIGNFATDLSVQDFSDGDTTSFACSSRPAAIPRSRGPTSTATRCAARPARTASRCATTRTG